MKPELTMTVFFVMTAVLFLYIDLPAYSILSCLAMSQLWLMTGNIVSAIKANK